MRTKKARICKIYIALSTYFIDRETKKFIASSPRITAFMPDFTPLPTLTAVT